MMNRISAFYQVHIADRLARLREEEDGAALAEYAVIFVVVAVAGAGGLSLLGAELDTAFNDITTWIATNITSKFATP
ncbi:MAG: hypothetical protein R3C97_15425 [Geminicoccaceae bacterium]